MYTIPQLRPHRPLFLLAILGGLLPSLVRADDFNNRVKPILSQHCFTCHGPDAKQRKGDLRLDLSPHDGAMTPERFTEVFGDGHKSSLIYQRIATHDVDDRMPPAEKPGLSDSEIATLAAWLDDGAPYEKHWAFVPPAWPDIPQVELKAWVKNDIDRFIVRRLEVEGIKPAPLASPETRLRRVYLDLVGLLPPPVAIEAFTADPSDALYARIVDELLASPHFGERWGRHWLDAARYADSNGYSIDGPREIWPYRDWVIDAVNADKPFDDFVVEQLAGDLLPEATRAQRVATGFHRNTMINQEGGIDKEEFRIEGVVDRVNTTGAVFLGLTLGCAKCHDHKYDPVYQDEYYKLFAFYNNDDEIDLDLPSEEQASRIAVLKKEIAGITPERDVYRAEAIQGKLEAWLAAQPEEVVKNWGLKEQAAQRMARTEWTDEQERLLQKRFLQLDETYREFEARIQAIRGKLPNVPQTMVLRKRSEARESHLFEQGDFTRLGEKVLPGTPAVLHAYDGPEFGNRLDLARWIVDRENPLTARVTVNRYWQHLFGRGLVETENDFGYQGALPSHPDLLDYLANQFIARGWSTKQAVREMVLSATYQQSSHHRDDLDVVDPRNYLLARQNRVRLDAEIIRDVTLAASGKLNATIGGPGVYPPQPDGVMKLGQRNRPWDASQGGDRFRRGMYTFYWRATPHPALAVFDAPDAMVACTRRSRSNTPLQALTLLNDAAFVEQAQAFGTRLAEAPMETDDDRIRYAIQLSLNRTPSDHEMTILRELIADARKQGGSGGAAEWVHVARTLFNLDEFITRE